jgi:acyl dehydratase
LTITVCGLDGLRERAGHDLGYSEWTEVPQERIDAFADATDDHQWIHVNPERATKGPFGQTIAHGYLTLSLLIPLWNEVVELQGVRTAVNYGLNRVRFPAPVPAGAKIRLGAFLTEVTDVPGDGVQAVVDFTVHCDRTEKPVCVAQAVYRYYL